MTIRKHSEDWEKIVAADSTMGSAKNPYNVWRLPVPGGWIYVHANYGVNGSVFVPDPELGKA